MNISTLIQIGQIIPKNIISDAIRWISIGLDSIMYGYIGLFFNLIFSMTNLTEMTLIKNVYEGIQEKVYLIIGIFMLFKVTISLLTYLANPDKMNDKEIGAGKLVTRIVTSLVLLIVVPTIVFPLLHEIQIPLLNTVGKMITGQVANLDGDSALAQGQEAALTVMGAFFYPDEECIVGTSEQELSHITQVTELVNLPCETADGTNKSQYMYTYVFGVSNIVATVTIVLLIVIAINVAIRAFKLLVLEVLAPIPILSYIDPKSSKDGMFSSYTKLFTKTYLDLFIQFGIFYLVITIIGKLAASAQDLKLVATTGVEMIKNGSMFAFVFLFVGLLFFAFMAPKFIKKALNIKDSEFGTGLAGLLATTATVAGTTGAAVSGFATSVANNEPGKGISLKNVGAGIAGAIGGMSAGVKTGFGSGKTDASKVLGSIKDYNARAIANANAGSTAMGRAGDFLKQTFMGEGSLAKYNREIESNNEAFSKLKDYKSTAESKALEAIGDGNKGLRVNVKDAFNKWHNGLNYSEFMTHTQGAQNGNEADIKWFADHGWKTTDSNGNEIGDWQSAQSIIPELKDTQISEHMRRVVADPSYDGTTYNAYVYAQDACKEANVKIEDANGNLVDINYGALKDVKKGMGKTSSRISEIKTSDKYKSAAANQKANKK